MNFLICESFLLEPINRKLGVTAVSPCTWPIEIRYFIPTFRSNGERWYGMSRILPYKMWPRRHDVPRRKWLEWLPNAWYVYAIKRYKFQLNCIIWSYLYFPFYTRYARHRWCWMPCHMPCKLWPRSTTLLGRLWFQWMYDAWHVCPNGRKMPCTMNMKI